MSRGALADERFNAWLALVEKHGSHTAALEALPRQADELEQLKVAVRGYGLKPDLLLAN